MTGAILFCVSRRIVKALSIAALGLVLCDRGRSEEAITREAAAESAPNKLRIAVIGAHPDDPEAGVGALIASLSSQGHDVFIGYAAVYREGRQVLGRPEAEVRRQEAEEACAVMRAKPKFFSYSAGRLFPDEAAVADVSKWLDEVKPDIVLTHWPLDTHPDHHAISSIVWQCYKHEGGWNLYYFEVVTGVQSLNFTPNLYLDIEPMLSVKERAVFCHKSQSPAPPNFWKNHEQMHLDRGAECGRRYAEALFLVEAKPGCPLLPLELLPPVAQRGSTTAEAKLSDHP